MGAGGAATLATLASSKEARAGHDATNVMHLGQENSAPAGTQTKLLGNVGNEDADPGTAFIVENTNSTFGGAIEGRWHGPGIGGGVRGFNDSPGTPEEGAGPGVEGASENGPGVIGFGGTVGVLGLNNDADAVRGFVGSEGNATVAGVRGEAFGCVEKGPCGPGIGIGVYGRSDAGIGVQAKVDDATGFALDVLGRARFSSAGSASVPAGQTSVFVPDEAVGAASHISVTLMGNPGLRTLQWVERAPGSGFTVHLTNVGPKPETPLTYFVLEPG